MSLERLAQERHGDLTYRFNRPWSDGTTGIKLALLELLEELAAIAPLPRAHLVRYAGCLAPHSKLREAIIPTPRQQGVDGDESKTGTPYWNWARLLGRVFDLDLATCLPPLCGWREPCDLPFCRRGSLRIIAAIHPGVGHHAYSAPSQAGLRPTSDCPCPLSPRAIRVQLSAAHRN